MKIFLLASLFITLSLSQICAYSQTNDSNSIMTTVAPLAPTPTPIPAPVAQSMDIQQLYTAYNFAYSLYQNKQFDKAKDMFKTLATSSANQPGINANAYYYYSQCAFRTADYDECVKSLTLLAQKWPNSPAVQGGFVSKFAVNLIDQVTHIQSNLDYYRLLDNMNDKRN